MSQIHLQSCSLVEVYRQFGPHRFVRIAIYCVNPNMACSKVPDHCQFNLKIADTFYTPSQNPYEVYNQPPTLTISNVFIGITNCYSSTACYFLCMLFYDNLKPRSH